MKELRVAVETGFLIDGTIYEVPTLDSLTLDEAQLLYDRSGIVQEDFVPLADETEEEREERIAKLTRHPGFMASLVQIAYQRGNPGAKMSQVKLVLEKTNRMEAFSTLAEAEEEPDDVPLASTSERGGSSLSVSLDSSSSLRDSNESGGTGSMSGSDEPAAGVVSIGTSRSDTSSTSARKVSVTSGPAT